MTGHRSDGPPRHEDFWAGVQRQARRIAALRIGELNSGEEDVDTGQRIDDGGADRLPNEDFWAGVQRRARRIAALRIGELNSGEEDVDTGQRRRSQVIEVTATPERLVAGVANVLTVNLRNVGRGVFTNIVVRLAFTQGILVVSGKERIELERLEAGETRSYQFRVRPTSAGSAAITSDNFSYRDSSGRVHREQDLRIPLVMEAKPAGAADEAHAYRPDPRQEARALQDRISKGLVPRLAVLYDSLNRLELDEASYAGERVPLKLVRQIEQTREQIASVESELTAKRERRAVLLEAIQAPGARAPATTHDVFICHASEDKPDVARSLALALKERGKTVWLDEMEIQIGDSLRRKIDQGIRSSRFGVVILSPSFFAKRWTQHELDGLADRELSGNDVVVLPVWHGVGHGEVAAYSPSLGNKYAARTAEGLHVVADQIARRLDTLGASALKATASTEPPARPSAS
jgi:hypothetical protein